MTVDVGVLLGGDVVWSWWKASLCTRLTRAVRRTDRVATWRRAQTHEAVEDVDGDEDADCLLFRLGHAACTFPFRQQPFISSLDSARSAPAYNDHDYDPHTLAYDSTYGPPVQGCPSRRARTHATRHPPILFAPPGRWHVRVDLKL